MSRSAAAAICSCCRACRVTHDRCSCRCRCFLSYGQCRYVGIGARKLQLSLWLTLLADTSMLQVASFKQISCRVPCDSSVTDHGFLCFWSHCCGSRDAADVTARPALLEQLQAAFDPLREEVATTRAQLLRARLEDHCDDAEGPLAVDRSQLVSLLGAVDKARLRRAIDSLSSMPGLAIGGDSYVVTCQPWGPATRLTCWHVICSTGRQGQGLAIVPGPDLHESDACSMQLCLRWL